MVHLECIKKLRRENIKKLINTRLINCIITLIANQTVPDIFKSMFIMIGPHAVKLSHLIPVPVVGSRPAHPTAHNYIARPSATDIYRSGSWQYYCRTWDTQRPPTMLMAPPPDTA